MPDENPVPETTDNCATVQAALIPTMFVVFVGDMFPLLGRHQKRGLRSNADTGWTLRSPGRAKIITRYICFLVKNPIIIIRLYGVGLVITVQSVIQSKC